MALYQTCEFQLSEDMDFVWFNANTQFLEPYLI